MAGRTRILGADDLWSLAQELDVPGAVRAGLHRPPTGTAPRDGRVPALDPASGERCDLPAAEFGALRCAGLVALAARHLLPPGVVTAGLVGPAPEAWWHLAVLCRALPEVAHVTVCAGGAPVPPRLADELDLAGVGLSCVPGPAGTAFGSTLLVALDPAAPLDADHLAPGAVLLEGRPGAVGAAPRDLVDDVLPAERVLAALAAGSPAADRRDGPLLVEAPVDRVDPPDAGLAAALAAAAVRADLGLPVPR